eukprot:TRINITY_DN15775_c0_g1_i1.p1 TRINITY_DN15775_c0_g1~~TRINITY_DN15775_c0_g1_i1.p1  ORF type:complete len:128 (+),score=23.39 TRINITY_DN15775_c0_g1_i1:495-878(+)
MEMSANGTTATPSSTLLPSTTSAANPSNNASGTGSLPLRQILSEAETEIITRQKLQELMAQISPTTKLDTDVEEVLMDLADDFIESVTSFACELAKHRKSTTLETKDLQLHLEKNYNIKIPGFLSDV